MTKQSTKTCRVRFVDPKPNEPKMVKCVVHLLPREMTVEEFVVQFFDYTTKVASGEISRREAAPVIKAARDFLKRYETRKKVH